MLGPPGTGPSPLQIDTWDPADETNNLVLWRERERRQRTVRVLMMFLLMLLLMDGDEGGGGGGGRHRSNGLRKRGKPKNAAATERLDAEVYQSRLYEDNRIRQIAMSHPRYQALIHKNGEKNIELEILQWAQQQAEQEKDEFAQDAGKVVSRGIQPEEQRDPEEDRKVFHYPWNTTGFYRGEWSRQSESTQKVAKEAGKQADVAGNEKQEILDAVSLEPEMIKVLEERNQKVGVFILPQGKEIIMRDDNNLTSARWEQMTVDTVGRTYPPVARAIEDDAAKKTEQKAEDKQQTVTLTHESGRAAFQLFSRMIPSMKEISLVNGFVKLYDSTSPGYSTRKDILLRVRGVMIHTIGRMSLVSNVDVNRSALVLGGEHSNADEVVEIKEDERRRRLSEALADVESADVDRIREDVFALYSDQDFEEKYDMSFASPVFEEKAITSETTSTLQRGELAETTTGTPASTALGCQTFIQRKLGEVVKYLFPEIMQVDEDSALPTEYQSSVEHRTTESSNDSSLDQQDVKTENNEYQSSVKLNVAEDANESSAEQVTAEAVNPTATIEHQTLDEHRVEDGSSSAFSEQNIDEGAEHQAVKRKTVEVDHNSLPPRKQVSSERKTTETQKPGQPRWSSVVIPYPFVRDDKEESIRRVRTPAARRMPPREQLLEANAGRCEFEINMDVEEVEWTIGAWRNLVTRRVKEAKKLDPSAVTNEPETDSGDKSTSVSHSMGGPSRSRAKAIHDQALVMTMVGKIHSPNCGFTAALNATALRTDWEATTSKAINYSFYMMLVCLTQILVLLRQLLHSQSQSAATRVSLLCIGWQTVVDALICLAHIYLSLAIQPLFTAFASVAFFKLLIFCVIEMKYMAMIIQARNSSNGGQTSEVFRRQIAMLHLRFYVALFGAFLLVFYVGEKYRTIYALALYSFWVPQIVMNVITEAKNPLHKYYIYGMSLSRLVAPLYVFAVPNNFMKEVYPDSPTDPLMCQLLVVWVGIQAAILIAQSKYGARFMIPARFLPPKFDYSRPLPPSMLPPGAFEPSSEQKDADDSLRSPPASDRSPPASETEGLVPNNESSALRGRHATAETTRNRMRGNRVNRGESTMTAERVEQAANPSAHSLDCSICYDPIDVRNRSGYMLGPCNHLFHRDCLVQWMDVKMECPICRTDLPAL